MKKLSMMLFAITLATSYAQVDSLAVSEQIIDIQSLINVRFSESLIKECQEKERKLTAMYEPYKQKIARMSRPLEVSRIAKDKIIETLENSFSQNPVLLEILATRKNANEVSTDLPEELLEMLKISDEENSGMTIQITDEKQVDNIKMSDIHAKFHKLREETPGVFKMKVDIGVYQGTFSMPIFFFVEDLGEGLKAYFHVFQNATHETLIDVNVINSSTIPDNVENFVTANLPPECLTVLKIDIDNEEEDLKMLLEAIPVKEAVSDSTRFEISKPIIQSNDSIPATGQNQR